MLCKVSTPKICSYLCLPMKFNIIYIISFFLSFIGAVPEEKFPVMVWFHPGDFHWGTPIYWDASVLAARHKVRLPVTYNNIVIIYHTKTPMFKTSERTLLSFTTIYGPNHIIQSLIV